MRKDRMVFLYSLIALSLITVNWIEAASVKPNFDKTTTLGVFCNKLWDEIQDDRKAGKSVTSKVELYEVTCADTYGGSPRIAAETGVLVDSGKAVAPSVSPDQPTTEDKRTQLLTKVPNPGSKMAIQAMPKSGQLQQTQPGLQLQQPGLEASLYKVLVRFTSVTIHNTHEGTFSGDGEYDLNAYVHGKLVKLTDMSRTAGGAGLWDVSKGENIRFPPGNDITVLIDKSLPLTIFTVGSEIDGCGRTAFPENIQDKVVSTIQKVASLIGITGIQDELDKGINSVGCKLNSNDDIGDIVKAYVPVNYGSGDHIERSNKGDFTLAYTINATSFPKP